MTVDFGCDLNSSSMVARMKFNAAKMIFTLTYQPSSTTDTPPTKIMVSFRRRVTLGLSAFAHNSGDSANGSGSGTLSGGGGGDCTATDDVTAVGASPISASKFTPSAPEDFTTIVLSLDTPTTSNPSPKTFTFKFDLAGFVSGATYGPASNGEASQGNPSPASGGSILRYTVDFCVDGVDLSRYGPMSGHHERAVQDPSYTRWLPLSFSPKLNSQPFRILPGALTAPWGNINCFYSAKLTREPSDPNFDINGVALVIRQALNASGNFNPPASSFISNPAYLIPNFVVTDANGERVVFDGLRHSANYVHSSLTPGTGPGTFLLTNAGPPGDMKSFGNYAYGFDASGALTYIKDDLGNLQSCSYQSGNQFLTVTDSSSFRYLRFYKDASGYLSAVDAPSSTNLFDLGVNTHTVTTMDSTGHMTAMKVYDGTGTSLFTTETFAYGGPNGDSITSSSQGATQTTSDYASDSRFMTPFGLPTPRIKSVTYGSTGDASSSDSYSSIAGTWQYDWGFLSAPFADYSDAARTETVTDPRGKISKTTFHLNDVNEIDSLFFKGPGFTGSDPLADKTLLACSPDITHPTDLLYYDAISFASLQPGAPLSTIFPVVRIQANALGQPTSVIANGNHWQFGYAADNFTLTSVIDPLNLTTQYRYGEGGAPASRLTSVVDPTNAVRGTIAYNAFGQPTVFTNPAAVSVNGNDQKSYFTYEPHTGDLISVKDALGNIFTIDAYSPLGDPLSVTTYPDTGDPATSTHPMTTSIVYDAAQNVRTITGSDGSTLNFNYTNGVTTGTSVTKNINGTPTTLAQMNFSVDTRGRIYAYSDAVGSLRQTRYDATGNATQVWDGKGNVTKVQYGNSNEPNKLIWPDLRFISATYDILGRLASSTDENGNNCTMTYDWKGNLTDIAYSAFPEKNIHFSYDSVRRLTGASDGAGSKTCVYEPTLGRVTSVTTVINALPAGHNTFTCSYSYAPDGTITSKTTALGTTNFYYDNGGILSSITNPLGEATHWYADKTGKMTKQATVTSASSIITSDYVWGNPLAGQPDNFLSKIINKANGQQIWGYGILRTPLGQISLQSGDGLNATQTSSESFSYDSRGRVTQAGLNFHPDNQNNTSKLDSFGYDLANNLQGGTGGWSYNSNNQVTSAPALQNSSTLPGSSQLQYSVSGQLSSMNGNYLGYDTTGALRTFGTTSYVYDLAGNRISKTVGGVTTYFLYSGGELIAELDSAGTIQRTYTWGPAGLISDHSSTGSRFYLYDGLGNTRTLLGDNGQTIANAAYTAWGMPLGGNYLNTPFAYKGQWGAYRDSESGLFQMGARYYSPNIGSFVSRDPSGFSGGPNLYSYCAGDPVNFFDPNGMQQEGSMTPTKDWWHSADQNVHKFDSFVHPNLGPVSYLNPYPHFGIPFNLVDSVDSADLLGSTLENPKASGWDKAMAWAGLGGNAGLSAVEMYGVAAPGATALADVQEVRAASKLLSDCFIAGTQVQVIASNPVASSKKSKLNGKSTDNAHSAVLASATSTGTPAKTNLNEGIALKPIEQIRQGDLVLTRNEKTGKSEVKKVLRTTILSAPAVVSLSFADPKTGNILETVTATREHPFMVQGVGFVIAGRLALGNAIVTRAGPALTVAKIDWKQGVRAVFNFEVEEDHTYFVGSANGGLWVHNPGPCGMLGSPATQQLDRAIANDLEGAGWDVTHGAGLPQEAIADPLLPLSGRVGRAPGTVFPDITANKNGITMRIQTVDTYKNGMPTRRELANFQKILQRTGGPVYWFPKN